MKSITSDTIHKAEKLISVRRFRQAISELNAINRATTSAEDNARVDLLIVEAKLYVGEYNVREQLDRALDYYGKSQEIDQLAQTKFLHGWLLISEGCHFGLAWDICYKTINFLGEKGFRSFGELLE
jgi:hypothetical protein